MAEAHSDVTRNGNDVPASAVGTLLRQARERMGQSLSAAAQQLRIRDSYLKAIEEGDFRALPGATYAVGFLRSYADHLGLDPQEIVRRFREEVEELGRRTQLVFPSVPAEGKIPGGAILLIAFVVALLGYGGFYFLSERDRDVAELAPVGTASAPASEATTAAAPATAEPAATGTAAQAPAVSPDLNSAVAEAVAAATETGAEAAVPAVAATTETQTAAPATGETAAAATEAAPAADAASEAAAVAPAEATTPVETAATLPAASATDQSDEVDTVPETPSEVAQTPDTSQAALPEETVPPPATEAAITPPTETAELPPAPDEPATTSEPAAAESSPVAPADAAAGSAVASTTEGIPAAPEPPSATEDLPAGQQYGVTNADARVVLVATQEAWVQIKKASGEEVWTKVLRPGDRFMVPNESGLLLATGNAGGLRVMVDGKPVAALGPIGVVRRGIALDPDRLVDGTATP